MWKATHDEKGVYTVRYFNRELREQGYHRPGLFWVRFEAPRRLAQVLLDQLTFDPAPEGMRECRQNIKQQAAWKGQEFIEDVQTFAVRYFDEWDREVGYYLSTLGAWVEFERPTVRSTPYRERLEKV